MRLACEHHVETDSRAIVVNTLTQARILEEGRTEQIEIIVDSDPEGHYGIAVDIGTTTIVAFFMDLVTGEQLNSVSMLNPQIVYGEDIVTRLTSAAENSVKKKRLQSLVVNSIEELVSSLINHSEIEVSEITRFSIVGNTAMHHFFLGLDTSTLAVAPYTPAQTKGLVVQSSKLGFDKIVADMYCAPLIAGFVGSDITSLILAHRLHESDDITLGIDIGTNGEIVLSNMGEVYTCSTAAGSAFEGATISQGMRGQVGAIEHISILDRKNPPEITVIGHAKPMGLCGSGIVDVVSELLDVGALSQEGRLIESERVVRDSNGGLGYIVVNTGEHDVDQKILFTQKDVRQVQLAKGAILAGTKILMNTIDIGANDIDKILLAGAFGNYINPDSALRIGLLPKIPRERVMQVGNTAGVGAKMMLISSKVRELAEELVKEINYVELASRGDFQDLFIESTLFP